MTRSGTFLDDELLAWEDVCEPFEGGSLLIGNGFSQNIWKRFGYSSLYETAEEGNGSAALATEDKNLFDRFETRNFELVLGAICTCGIVADTLEQNTEYLFERYNSIRNALVAAVHYVHVPWNTVPDETLEKIATELWKYRKIYSTNYDVIVYWSLMTDTGRSKDYFFSGPAFDISDTTAFGPTTLIHYLHGGLHLYRKPNGNTLKRPANFLGNLLDLFGKPFGDAIPLCITEGRAEDKKSAIFRSDYLSFVFSLFEQDDGPLVVFGHSLSENDQHLVDALSNQPDRKMAISIRQGSAVRQRKARLYERLPDADLTFFDAATHPLGSPDLNIREDDYT